MHEHIPAMNTMHLAKMLIQKSLNIGIRQILRREAASPFLYIFFSLFEVSPTNRYLTDQSAESTIYTLSTMEGRFQN